MGIAKAAGQCYRYGLPPDKGIQYYPYTGGKPNGRIKGCSALLQLEQVPEVELATTLTF